MTYFISKTVDQPFDAVIADVTARLKEQGFGLLTDIDVQATLKSKLGAELTVPAGTDAVKAREMLDRAEHGCLIANSLRGSRSLEAQVIVADR